MVVVAAGDRADDRSADDRAGKRSTNVAAAVAVVAVTVVPVVPVRRITVTIARSIGRVAVTVIVAVRRIAVTVAAITRITVAVGRITVAGRIAVIATGVGGRGRCNQRRGAEHESDDLLHRNTPQCVRIGSGGTKRPTLEPFCT